MIETERGHWSKQARIEAGKRLPEERARDFREIYLEYASVVTAIKDGREAARGIDEHLRHLLRGESAGAEVLATERGQM